MGKACGYGLATIMGIGKAVPKHVVEQNTFADYYFDISNSNHMVDLKAKFAKICEKTMIERRYWYMSDEFLRSNPPITAYKSPSLGLRQQVADEAVPQLGAEAALNAINDWGRQASDITHLIFCTTESGRMPGADLRVARLLGLPLSTNRLMLYQVGCHGAGIALRLAKDIAENNPGARVLVVCSEVTAMGMRGPSEADMGNLVGQALFGDAAAAVVVGADPTAGERAMFEMVWASQDTIPKTENAVASWLSEEGIVYTLHRDLALYISSNIEELVQAALAQAEEGVEDWNQEVFWLVHPGGREVLDRVESVLGLRKEKLTASREAMRQHGNTLSASVLTAMDEMRRRSAERSLATAGEGLKWGLLFGFGPGLTVETILLRALPVTQPIA
ncbi:unnamed protein product [Urochloa decumbens]|uniref:Chalcone synthase n=1 Tax=Urochloa decumbens TaxID=240449 RepID=A0ABC8WCR7_9POAL